MSTTALSTARRKRQGGAVTKFEVTRACAGSDLPSSSKLVLLMLANLADMDGTIPAKYTPSIAALAKMTSLHRLTVIEHVKVLESAGWLVCERANGARTTYRLTLPTSQPPLLVVVSDRSTQQTGSAEEPVVPTDRSSEQTGSANRPGPVYSDDHFDDAHKKNSPTESSNTNPSNPSSRSEPEPRPDVEALCSRLADGVQRNSRTGKRPKIGKAWSDAARLLLDEDKCDLGEALDLIDWCQDDTFWKANVRSMPTFRKQYDRLWLRADEERKRGNGNRAGPGQRSGSVKGYRNEDQNTSDWFEQELS